MRRMGYKEAAEMAGVSLRKMRYLVESGEILARRCGSRVLIAERDLEEWLNSLPLVVVEDETDNDDIGEIETATDDETVSVDRPQREGATRTRGGFSAGRPSGGSGVSTESICAAAEGLFGAAHPADRRGAVIAGCRAAARVADSDHAVAFTIGALADEERSRAAAIDTWLNHNWARIAP